MTQVLFSFDTEDYTNPGADEAIRMLAGALGRQGVKGCFNLVGELAMTLEARGRQDIIALLQNHEIDFHSWRHTWHPTLVEYGDVTAWEAGYARFFRDESRASQAVKRIFKRDRLFAAVPPGNCIAAQAPYVYHDLDMPLYSGSLFKNTKGKTIWYCNQPNLENNLYLDDVLLGEGAESFLKRAEEYLDYDRVIVCMHPNISLYDTFWDALNCCKENQVPFGQWRLPSRRPQEQIDAFYQGFSDIVKYFRTTPGFELVTYEDIYHQEKDRRKPLTKERLLAALEKAKDAFFFVKVQGETFSLAELFEACAFFAGDVIGSFTPRGMKGPLEEPFAASQPVSLTREEVAEAAAYCRQQDAVPGKIIIGQKEIGPADFMWAVQQLLMGKEEIQLTPFDCKVKTEGYYRFDQFALKGTWMHANTFTDQITTKRLQWQAWTIRE